MIMHIDAVYPHHYKSSVLCQQHQQQNTTGTHNPKIDYCSQLDWSQYSETICVREMDVLQDIQNNLRETKDCEVRSKMILELSERKYNLQKKLRDDAMKLSEREISLTELRKEVVGLGNTFMMLEKQEKIALEMVESLTKQVVVQEEEKEKSQAIYWKKINDFISKSVQHLKKQAPAEKKPTNNSSLIETKNRRETLRQCELQGRLDALVSFEMYQTRKIEYLVQIKNTLGI